MKSSQNAGCIFRSPASHCCQVLAAACTSAAAWAWVRSSSSRALRICFGVGELIASTVRALSGSRQEVAQ